MLAGQNDIVLLLMDARRLHHHSCDTPDPIPPWGHQTLPNGRTCALRECQRQEARSQATSLLGDRSRRTQDTCMSRVTGDLLLEIPGHHCNTVKLGIGPRSENCLVSTFIPDVDTWTIR